MKRAITTIAAGILIVTVLADPYTFCFSGSDACFPAPFWQTAFGLTDILLLAWVVRLVWRKRADLAIWAMLAGLRTFVMVLPGSYTASERNRTSGSTSQPS